MSKKRKRRENQKKKATVEAKKDTADDTTPLPLPPSPLCKLTDELSKQICELAATPLHKTHIAWAVGINRDTLTDWITRGETAAEGDEAYSAFSARFKKARAKLFAERLGTITAASEKSWQASAWITERLAPDEYSDPAKELYQLRNEVAELRKLVNPEEASDAGSGLRELLGDLRTLRRNAAGASGALPGSYAAGVPVCAEPRPANEGDHQPG